MNRRRLLSFLGLAPIAAVASSLPSSGVHQYRDGIVSRIRTMYRNNNGIIRHVEYYADGNMVISERTAKGIRFTAFVSVRKVSSRPILYPGAKIKVLGPTYYPEGNT